MESRAKLLGHPIHPILVVFPLGLLATSFIFDIVYLLYRNPTFSEVSFWMILAGVIGGLIAAVFGTIDWLAIPRDTRAKAIGMYHGLGNVLVTGLFALSLYLRWQDSTGHEPDSIALILSGLAVLTALGTGWLGGELSYRLAVGVDEGANLNAPNSLSGRPAHESVEETGQSKMI